MIKVLLIIFTLLFLFIVYLMIFSLCKVAKKSDEKIEEMLHEQEKGDCLSCVLYQTMSCPLKPVYPMKDCPYYIPLIPFA